MAKRYESDPEPIPVTPVPPPAATRAAAPVARVIQEYRGPAAEGGPAVAVRLADFPQEAAAGWHRYKVTCRVPYEATHPTLYVLAPDQAAAEKCCRAAHGLDPLPEAIAQKLQTVAHELTD